MNNSEISDNKEENMKLIWFLGLSFLFVLLFGLISLILLTLKNILNIIGQEASNSNIGILYLMKLNNFQVSGVSALLTFAIMLIVIGFGLFFNRKKLASRG